MKKLISISLLSFMLIAAVPNISDARAVLVHATSYADSNGCIWIEETWEHRFAGINWYTTTNTYSPNCGGSVAP